MKTRFLAIPLFCLLPLTTSGQTAEEIAKKAVDARGGADKIKAVQTERVTGRILFAPGVDGTFAVELKRPHKMRMEITVEGQKIIRVYDGKANGWMLNPFAQDKVIQPMSPEELKSILDESDLDGPLVDYQAKGNRIELVGKELLDDKPVFRLKLTNKYGEARFYIFDAATFLLVKWEGTRRAEDQEVPWESYFSDYKEAGGLKYAFRIDSSSPGTDIKQTLTAEKIEIDTPIDDSRFTKPSTLAAPAGPSSGTPPASAPARN